MAEHAHITPAPTPHVRPVTTRRTLGATLFATVIGTGITAGTAASIADLVPPNPDRDLIALCDRYIATELARKAIYDGPDAIADDKEAYAASMPLFFTMNEIIEQMDLVRARTAEGVLARVKVLFVENGDFGCSFDYVDSPPGRLLALLMRDAEGLMLTGRA